MHKKENHILLGILTVALVLRIAFVIQLIHSPVHYSFAQDSTHFHEFALSILQGTLHADAHLLNPLYPFFLSFIYLLFGTNTIAVMFVQFAMDMGNILLLYLIARTIFQSVRTAQIAAVIYALFNYAFFYAGFLLAPTLNVFLFLLTTYLIIRSEKKHIFLLIPAGIAFGLASLSRTNIIVLLPFIILYFPDFFRHRSSIFSGLKKNLLFLPSFLLILFVNGLINYQAKGDFSIFSSQGGITFYIGNNPQASGTFFTPKGLTSQPVELAKSAHAKAEKELERSLSASEASSYWIKKGLDYNLSHPLQGIRLQLKKLYMFFHKDEVDANMSYRFLQEIIPLLRFPFPSYGLVFSLGLCGLLLSLKRKESNLLVNGLIIGYMLSVVAFIVSDRLRFPVVPFMSMYAAYFIVYLPTLFSPVIRFRELSIAVIIIAIGNISFNNKELPEDLAIQYNNLGISYKQNGKTLAAIKSFEKAIELDPEYPLTYYNLGNIFRESNDCKRAVALYRYYLQISTYPGDAPRGAAICLLEKEKPQEALNILLQYRVNNALHEYYIGLSYFRLVQFEEAIKHFEKSHALNKELSRPVYYLGESYAKTGNIEQSQYYYNLALEKQVSPDEKAHTLFQISNTKILNTQFNEAIHYGLAALEQDPSHAGACYNLGFAYMRLGDQQKSVEYFKLSVQHDTTNFMAYYYIGNHYFYKENFTQALHYYDLSVAVNDQYFQSLYNAGVASVQTSQYDKARSYWNKAIQQQPDNPELQHYMRQLDLIQQ